MRRCPGPSSRSLAALRDVWPDLRDVAVDRARPPARGARLVVGPGRAHDAARLPACPTAWPISSWRAVSACSRGSTICRSRRTAASSTRTTSSPPAPAGDAGATLDARVAAWFVSSSPSLRDALIRAVHDATIDAAVARFVVGRRVVGVMGGHALDRDAAFYRTVAVTGRALTRAGFTVATGGGPGVMEAANLGAWMAPFADDALDDALAMLADARRLRRRSRRLPCAARSRCARAGRDGGESLGVPDVGVRGRADDRVRDAHRQVLHEQHPRGRPARDRPFRRRVRAGRRGHRAGDLHRHRAEQSHALQGAQPDGVLRRRVLRARTPRARDRGPPAGDRVRLVRSRHGVRRARRRSWRSSPPTIPMPRGTPASSAADCTKAPDHARSRRPRARRRHAVRRGVRPHPRRVRGPGRVSRGGRRRSRGGGAARSGHARRRRAVAAPRRA